jgi:hypothetical protein
VGKLQQDRFATAPITIAIPVVVLAESVTGQLGDRHVSTVDTAAHAINLDAGERSLPKESRLVTCSCYIVQNPTALFV